MWNWLIIIVSNMTWKRLFLLFKFKTRLYFTHKKGGSVSHLIHFDAKYPSQLLLDDTDIDKRDEEEEKRYTNMQILIKCTHTRMLLAV